VAVRLTFAVYEEPQGGAALWAEAQMLELDEQGHYSVLLGATRSDGLPVELFPAGKARWLGVQVEGRDEDPRVLLVSVPYALKAEDAAKLGGRSASDFVLTEQLKEEVRTQVEAQKPATSTVETLVSNPPNLPAITEGPSTFTCATTGDCVAVTQSGTGRALRATATSGSEAALLQQNGTGYGLRVLSQSNYAIYGVVQGAVVGTTYGVRGQANSTTGAGVMGTNAATTGVAYGIAGQTSSVSGIGLYGRALSTTGTTVGLMGNADSTSGTGISGRATATSGTTMGIYAEARSADGTALVLNNTAGGKLLSGLAGGVEKLSVDGTGSLNVSGTLTLPTDGLVAGTDQLALVSGRVGIGTASPRARIHAVYGGPATFMINVSDAVGGECTGSYCYGIHGVASGYQAMGVEGYGTGTQSRGVYGTSNGASGFGVVAGASGSGGTALFAAASGSAIQAGTFNGNVTINGNLDVNGTVSKNSGAFKIDHPIDPADKYLSHSFVESPDMKNVYDGVAVLDVKGEAWVALPSWFEALNSDFRYQLTAIGAPGPNLYVAEEVATNHFKIAGGKRGMKVSWQVTGIRQDAYAKAHRIPVEENKPAAEKGYYLHPELFGQPKEKGIEWAHRSGQMQPSPKEQAKRDERPDRGGLQSGRR
jgi:hypothetical protein